VGVVASRISYGSGAFERVPAHAASHQRRRVAPKTARLPAPHAIESWPQAIRPAPRKRKATPQKVVGSALLAFSALASIWILFSNLLDGDDDRFDSAHLQTMKVETVAFGTDTVPASFNERFGPFGDSQPVSPDIAKNYFALLDPGYSFGAAPGTFSKDALPEPVQMIAHVRDIDTQQAQGDVPLSSTVREAMQHVPLPPPRPVQKPLTREIAQAGREAGATVASKAASIFEKLFGSSNREPKFAVASADDSTVQTTGSLGAGNLSAPYDPQTAVYDITARKVYLSDGTALEAHSGLGDKLDDPRFVNVRMQGATPPHLYDLTLRESLFHGVEALRLNPVGGEEAIHGRSGLLAHTYMLGPNGDSNGCVSFKDYNRFLQAYKKGLIKRLAVVAKVE
jgi:hypothetical protein